MADDAAEEITENDNGLLGRVLLELRLGVAIIVDDVESITQNTNDRQVGQAPDPSEGSAKLAGLRLGSFVRIGSSEGDTARAGKAQDWRRASGTSNGSSVDETSARCRQSSRGDGRIGKLDARSGQGGCRHGTS